MKEINEIAKEYKEILATEETLKTQPGIAAGSNQKAKPRANASSTKFNASKHNRCMVCEKTDHRTYKCPTLINETVENRIKLIAKKGICKKCLNHPKAEKCNSMKSCNHCGMGNHNTVLHVTKKKEKLTSRLTKIDGNSSGLLPTIKIQIKTK